MADNAAAPELPPGWDADHSGISIFVVVFCLVVSTVMVGLRVYTRRVIINQMGIDDWAAIVTLVSARARGPRVEPDRRPGRLPIRMKAVD